MRSPARFLLAGALVLATIVGPFSAHAAEAADDPAGTITWMVRPSDGQSEDGRSWIEHDSDPGESIDEHLIIRNLSPVSVTFRLSAADGYFTETGRFNMLTSDRESTDAGTWIRIQDSVDVASGAEVVVPFTITVPDDATPGDHLAGVAAAIRSGGDEVGVESRVGFRVMTRVVGELTPSSQTELAGAYTGSVNPFEPGAATLSYTVTNTGNTRLAVDPSVKISGPFGWFTQQVHFDPIAEIAPGESRTLEAHVTGIWPLFSAFLSSESQVSAIADVSGAEVPPAIVAESSVTVSTPPWSQLVLLALLALAIALVVASRRRRRRRTEELIDRARAEARAEAMLSP